MRLVKQTVLFFKEGNSDKTYEIDLCDTGSDTYVVNFRYGRRGVQLKEGSKTPVPVGLDEARKIFDAIETEKISKGYTVDPSGISAKPQAPAFKLDQQLEAGISTGWMGLPASRHRAIMQRLYHAVNGQADNSPTQWKLSRIIWKAGEYKMREATPYIVKLFNKGSQLHQYSCCWALARMDGGNAIAALQAIYNDHPSPLLNRIAGAGLTKNPDALERAAHLQRYLNTLPEDMKQVIANQQWRQLEALATERIAQLQTNYNWLEALYLVAADQKPLRVIIKKILLGIALRPGYFKHIRVLFKLAELLDDFEILGLLSCRMEREPEMFTHHLSERRRNSVKTYVPETGEYLKLGAEQTKANSRLAYSNKTRWHFHHRTLRRLEMLGNTENPDYVRLATAILISYNRSTDEKEFYSEYNYKWRNNQYDRIETRFPASAHAIYMHQLLSGNNPQLKRVSGNRWQIVAADAPVPAKNKPGNSSSSSGGILKMISGLFSKKKTIPTPPAIIPATPPVENTTGTPFLHLWNQLPQAYIQLLMDAQMDEIHEFALGYLKKHADYNNLVEKLDGNACKKLLLAPYTIPAAYGFELTEKKYTSATADTTLVASMFNSIHEPARVRGREWTSDNQFKFLQDSGFITSLIFVVFEDTRNWGKTLLRSNPLPADLQKTVTGKAIALLNGYTAATAPPANVIKEATDTLVAVCQPALSQLNNSIVADLLQHPVPEVLLFGLRILGMQKNTTDLNELSDEFINSLLHHPYAPVRAEGLAFLQEMNTASQLKRFSVVLTCCVAPQPDLRRGIAPIIATMAAADKAFGDSVAAELMPLLLRKETSEGLHEDISHLLCNELSNHLGAADKATALNLLYSNYAPAQKLGVVILEKYTSPSALTIPQVIALGGHENLSVREWCWKFYREQLPRIKYEKETAIKLLDSKWDDTRSFARQFFKDTFEEKDWDSDLLITLADSSKQDTEAFARELITTYFQSDKGHEYLEKLSQHPREKMQLFVTNYLERYAANSPEKLQSLEFYFRSVLTRVNKGRIAKNRVFLFLASEGKKSETAAKLVSNLLSGLSATAAIEDKARCIEILSELQHLYAIDTPLQLLPVTERISL